MKLFFECLFTFHSEAVKKMAIEGVRARHVFGPSVYPTNTDTSQAVSPFNTMSTVSSYLRSSILTPKFLLLR